MAQSALFIAIFYGIQIIWERDAGVLTKLMVTPTPRSALITGKAFAAGVRSLIQAAVVVVLSAILGVALTDNPLKLIAAAVILVLGSAFFSCLSMTIAGARAAPRPADGHRAGHHDAAVLQLQRALPGQIMPGWLQVITKINPLTYEVDALRGLLIGTPANLWLDVTVLVGATIAGISAAAALLPRLAKG